MSRPMIGTAFGSRLHRKRFNHTLPGAAVHVPMIKAVAALGHAIVANNGSDSQTIVAFFAARSAKQKGYRLKKEFRTLTNDTMTNVWEGAWEDAESGLPMTHART
jgi:hypothetical protein